MPFCKRQRPDTRMQVAGSEMQKPKGTYVKNDDDDDDDNRNNRNNHQHHHNNNSNNNDNSLQQARLNCVRKVSR